MKGSQRHRTTKSGSKKRRNLSNSSKPPAADHVSFNLDQVGSLFGSWLVISPERRYTTAWSGLYVEAQCQKCMRGYWVAYSNLTTGKSKACMPCSNPLQVPKWLSARLAVAKDRCTNPANKQWARYGARGIRFNFPSVLEAGLYVMKTLGVPPRTVELDREDNDGHYEPGNLRWVSKRLSRSNTSRSRLPDWDPKAWPYAKNPVSRRLRAGMTREQVIADAWEAVSQKRKNWRGILAKLMSMTS